MNYSSNYNRHLHFTDLSLFLQLTQVHPSNYPAAHLILTNCYTIIVMFRDHLLLLVLNPFIPLLVSEGSQILCAHLNC